MQLLVYILCKMANLSVNHHVNWTTLYTLIQLFVIIVAMAPLSAAGIAEQAVMLNLMLAANSPFFPQNFLSGFPHVPFPGMSLLRIYFCET